MQAIFAPVTGKPLELKLLCASAARGEAKTLRSEKGQRVKKILMFISILSCASMNAAMHEVHYAGTEGLPELVPASASSLISYELKPYTVQQAHDYFNNGLWTRSFAWLNRWFSHDWQAQQQLRNLHYAVMPVKVTITNKLTKPVYIPVDRFVTGFDGQYQGSELAKVYPGNYCSPYVVSAALMATALCGAVALEAGIRKRAALAAQAAVPATAAAAAPRPAYRAASTAAATSGYGIPPMMPIADKFAALSVPAGPARSGFGGGAAAAAAAVPLSVSAPASYMHADFADYRLPGGAAWQGRGSGEEEFGYGRGAVRASVSDDTAADGAPQRLIPRSLEQSSGGFIYQLIMQMGSSLNAATLKSSDESAPMQISGTVFAAFFAAGAGLLYKAYTSSSRAHALKKMLPTLTQTIDRKTVKFNPAVERGHYVIPGQATFETIIFVPRSFERVEVGINVKAVLPAH